MKLLCRLIFLILLILPLTYCSQKTGEDSPKKVNIKKKGNSFYLYINNERTFVKGARTIGTEYMDLVSSIGGNSVRIGSHGNVSEKMNTAHKNGLTVLYGLPVDSERNGFDYDDTVAVSDQKERVLEHVKEYKDHPALLMWAIGNELDYVPNNPDYNKNLWNAVNDIAIAIKEIDPDHPVITVIGTGRKEKMSDIVNYLTEIDALGINSYGDIEEVPLWLRKYGFSKPYLITEWGPTGHWQVPRNSWGLPFEETSSQKADLYYKRHQQVIDGDPWCLGGYSFLWTQNRQERTHTWYNMFYDNGEPTEAVEIMQYVWMGEWPSNRAPRIDTMLLNGSGQGDDILLQPGRAYTAEVIAYDPDEDAIRYTWEIYPENTEFGYAGHGEKRPAVIKDLITDASTREISFVAPEIRGDYRLFVYVRDVESRIAIANLPFHVNE